MDAKPEISFEEFAKLDVRVGTIVLVEEIPNSEKLWRLEVDFGDEKRQILSGIKKWYTAEALLGRQCMFIVNLAPRMMMGLESQGMLLAGHGENGEAILYTFDTKIVPGTNVS